jgi:integrase
VKNKEARFVPLHPNLQPSHGILGRIGEWVRKEVGITDPAISPNHAWRHRFRTVCDDVGIEQKYVNAVCGHAPGSEGERYGERSATALRREIEWVPRYSD